ncbi:MAG: alpha/beta hydrolase [Gammaproteobacteria bacterium]|nr:alpha/beta hydrolase [Gammaproteobacteria bacterium]MBT8110394.1 alpha/beta hydrolase [Gammaproteobacteria bacterium]NND46416.1 alpha/beta hydrolase [Woeseiaceae bacterium]NNL45095.1 alpha/beta hydrolase [Woeseiaceae bacterium]
MRYDTPLEERSAGDMANGDNAHYFQSSDGLQLYYRDYSSDKGGTPVLCLPGLTRNSRDFEDLANYLSDRRRVITPDLRGRGLSDYDPEWRNYNPSTYVQDTWALLDTLAIDKVIVVGTSLGGICAMAMSAQQKERVTGVILNDIGPEVNPAGAKRVREHAGRAKPVRNWDEAIAQFRSNYAHFFPGLSAADWRKLVQRGYRENGQGIPELDVDLNVGEAARKLKPKTGDLWQMFDTLSNTPAVLLWGVLSDLLTEDIVRKMQARKPDLEVVPISNRGHVPLLNEPECRAAIDGLVDRVR